MLTLLFVSSIFALASAQQCTFGQKTVDGTVLKCVNGTWTPIACSMAEGKVVNDGDVTQVDSYMMQCQKVEDDETKLRLVSIGCIKDGKVLAPSQTHVSQGKYYTCTYKGDSVVYELSGCFGQNAVKVPIGSTVDKEMGSFKCISADNSVLLVPIGCRFNNVTYEFDKEIVDETIWFTCQKTSDNMDVTLVPKGCVNDGFKLFPDEVFQRRGYLYKCVVTEHAVRAVGVGCLEPTEKKNVIEHKIGEKWVEGLGKMKYMVECAHDSLGMFKKPVACYFTTEKGAGVSLSPGCMKTSGKFLYQCLKVDVEGLRSVQIENPSGNEADLANHAGLKVCNFA